jgi:hypothetical protein
MTQMSHYVYRGEWQLKYDNEKYRDMLLEAQDTVLGYFGFDRTSLGVPPRKSMKWWQRLKEEKLGGTDSKKYTTR